MAKAECVSNKAQLETARVDLERYSNLLAADAIARQQVDHVSAQRARGPAAGGPRQPPV